MLIAQPRVGELLRQWRERRRLSQLDLALQAEVSTRHLSFLETGRASPSREMLLRLAEQLEVPLRDRNELLLSAGYAPAYTETPVDAPPMAAVRDALRQVLAAHEPFPAFVVDRHWNLIDANQSTRMLTDHIPADLLEPPVNVLRASLHPRGLATRIVNLAEWRAHVLRRLRRQVALTSDDQLAALYDELRGYPGDAPATTLPEHSTVVVPLRLRHPAGELAFFSMLSTCESPSDITVDDLAIESFFPADEFTRSVARSLHT
ncbi:MAG: helix-turn-helix transcriptional regulator [Chloroflexi bacterium]|nr:helix-turn-helix transcriptional regulator [Chloroflexota bacterium]